ncbi:hypothetical protein ACLB90_07690 [Stenotrophomonas sp. LGBM10]|uniref:hypothetical protein n=1 Tax=Stenotrophomonas sp. LGBM10 TaxID=3390038 RepID=UPI00398B300F
MSMLFQLRVMTAVLRQARLAAVISTLLAAAALLLASLAQPGLLAMLLALASLLAAGVQAYYAARVGFDAALLEAMQACHPDAAPGVIDDVLQKLGLREASATSRGWQARWQGMRRLMRWQLFAVGAQAVLLLAALLSRWVAW